MTYDSRFMDQLCERTKTTYGVFIQSLFRNQYLSTFFPVVDNNANSNSELLSLRFLPHAVKIEAAHTGILVCVGRNSRNTPQYYVCKPTTKEWEQIHNPKTRYMTEQTSLMVLRSNPLRYKIVRFSRPKCPCSKLFYNLRCEVYDSEARGWKQLNNVALPNGIFLSFKPAVSACGALHWLLSDNRVFAFHVYEENWETFALPCPTSTDSESYKHNLNKLVEYQGRLAWVCGQGEDLMELWVMEDYKNKVWSKRRIIRLIGLDLSTSLGTLCSNDVALMRGFYQITFYKFEDYSSKVVKLKGICSPDEFFMLQSDSEPTDLRGPLKSSISNVKMVSRSSKELVAYNKVSP